MGIAALVHIASHERFEAVEAYAQYLTAAQCDAILSVEDDGDVILEISVSGCVVVRYGGKEIGDG